MINYRSLLNCSIAELLNMLPSLFSAFLFFVLLSKANGIGKDNHVAVCSNQQSSGEFNIFENESVCTPDYCHIELNFTTPLVPPLMAGGYSENSESDCYITENDHIAMDIHFAACTGSDQLLNLKLKKREVTLEDAKAMMKDFGNYVYNSGSSCVAIEVENNTPLPYFSNIIPFFECFIVSGFGVA